MMNKFVLIAAFLLISCSSLQERLGNADFIASGSGMEKSVIDAGDL